MAAKEPIPKGPLIRRLFLARIPGPGQEVVLSSDERHYISQVLRLKTGDALILFDGSGWEYEATVKRAGPKHVRVKIGLKRPGKAESPVQIHLGIGLLKAQKMDWVIQKAVELGVSSIFPVDAHRTVPRLRADRIEQRQARWRKIVQEACRQCGRTLIPAIHPVSPFGKILKKGRQADVALLFSANTDTSLDKDMRKGSLLNKEIFILVGPEGGFTTEEEQAAFNSGFSPVTLGPRILRAETAAIFAVGLTQFCFGDLGV